MYPADSIPAVPSVKLFPRLALPHATSRRRRAPRAVAVPIDRPVAEDVELRRSQMRARLLRMILDNEQVRRNEQRPSAS